jgi:hypothetical protein
VGLVQIIGVVDLNPVDDADRRDGDPAAAVDQLLVAILSSR